ncbi:MAG: thermonuclease family protein [Candidatus Omnitrophica bacterium]|nr:thermonuclease family protein [Candidatus Omnitrophota bacterium]
MNSARKTSKTSAVLPALASYAELRRRVEQTLLRAKRQIEEVKVLAYWDTGRDINEHVKIHGGRAAFGKKVILRLAKYLGLDDSVLDRFSELAEAFPREMVKELISAGRQKLPGEGRKTSKKASKNGLIWTHFRTLFPIREDKLRHSLARQAAREGWTVPELEERIKSLSAPPKSEVKFLSAPKGSKATKLKTELLKPKKGELFTYRIIQDAGVLALDHGFAKYWNLSPAEAKKYAEGDIVRKPPGRKMKKITNGKKPLLYTYEADVSRVVDGDTIWMKIYLEGRGNRPWVKEKLRLRDIDAPELKTPEGRAAKKFVEEQIAGKRVLITTTKPDKWDRYLSDVFFTDADGREIYLNNLLLETGHARIKTDWSLKDWEV